MPFITTKCPQCGKLAESEREFEINGKTILRLKCGHLLSKEHLKVLNIPENIRSLDNKKLFPYQNEGVQFIMDSGGRCLLGDEMGLGKTVQGLGMLACNPEMLKFCAIVKSSLKYQWQHEAMRWLGEDCITQVIEKSNDFILPGMSGYIIPYDLVARIGGKKLSETLLKRGVKTIFLDECQQIKNTEAARTVAVRTFCKEFPYVVAMSGTPIKNNAGEFFPVLNILKPEMFPVYASFLGNECMSNFNGFGYKVGGLRNPERFKEKTKSFIIRRERAEVLPDLPLIQRSHSFHELGPEVEKAYIAAFKEFRDEYNSGSDEGESFEEQGNILAYLSKMRHIVGLSKINPCLDHCMEFLGSCERKITIFFHHKDVGEILFQKLSELLTELKLNAPLRIISEMNSQQRFDTVQEFTNNPKARILLASTLAAGEGLNLQVCSDYIILERQWNPANEEQAEARFPRPGQKAQSINGTYFVAIGTVDEFFAEIVEQKREIVHSALDGRTSEVPWDQSSIIKELSFMLANNGGKRWSI